MDEQKFTKIDTNILKGIAILLMVMHHLNGQYYVQYDPDWYAEHSNGFLSMLLLFISTAGKVCVSLFTILSGYGMSKSYQKWQSNTKTKHSIYFTLSHIFNFYSLFCFDFLLAIALFINTKSKFSEAYGNGTSAIVNLLGNLLGINHYGFGDWFVLAIIILYFLFPILYDLTQKHCFKILICNFVLMVLILLFPFKYSLYNSILLCILPFTTGIFLAQTDILSYVKSNFYSKKCIIFSSIMLVLCFLLRLLFATPMDFFFALSIIFFELIIICNLRIIPNLLAYIGSHSANIWLFHVLFLRLIQNFITTHLPARLHEKFVLYYPAIIICSLMLSIAINCIRKYTKIEIFIGHIREIIENAFCKQGKSIS